ncbi:MAG: septation protein SepH, partial [Actinomycetota bacterium]|nr:septation protein SepH [Actinomycetota bacterium]
MVELELVGLGEDGTHLVLADAAGDEFTVPLDSRLRAVVRDDVRTGTLETSMESAPAKSAPAESTLRPRDIQARIRAGESPEAVAEIAQVPVQRILTYAVPVMAERSHMADRAQRSAVRRRHAEGPGTMLGDAVAERLREDRVDSQACEWDAWRREDGRWTVTARYRSDEGERTGTFVYDALSRYAVADDDGGRWLVGEKIQEQEPGRGRSSRRRLSAVASEYDAMLFDDEEPTADLTAVADAVGDRPAA